MRDIRRISQRAISAHHHRQAARSSERLISQLWDCTHPITTWALLRRWRRRWFAEPPIYAALTGNPQAAEAWLAQLPWRQALGILRNAPWWHIPGRVGSLLIRHAVAATLIAARELPEPGWQRVVAMWQTCFISRLKTPRGRGRLAADLDVDVEPRRGDASDCWAEIGCLLDAMDHSPGLHRRLAPVLSALFTRMRGNLRAHLRHHGVLTPDRAAPLIQHHDQGIELRLNAWVGLRWRWLGTAWDITDSDGQRRDYALAGVPLEGDELAQRLQALWIRRAAFIPRTVLAEAQRLPAQLATDLALQGRGLCEGQLPGNVLNTHQWWQQHLQQPLSQALRKAEASVVPPVVLALGHRLSAAGVRNRGQAHLGPLTHQAFWQHPYLVRDVLRHDAAAIILSALVSQPAADEERTAVLLTQGWAAACSHPVPPSRSLRRSLGALCLSDWPALGTAHLCDLHRLPLSRPLTGLGLLVGLVLAARMARDEPHPMTSIAIACDPEHLQQSIQRWLHQHLRGAAPANPDHTLSSISDCFDCPDACPTISQFVRHSMRWHAQPELQRYQRGRHLLSPETPLAPLPVALPELSASSPIHLRILATVGDLMDEGAAMHHCIGSASYIRAGREGRAYYLHLQYGSHHASIELNHELAVVQARGPHNARNSACLWAEDRLPRLLGQNPTDVHLQS